MTAEPFSFRHKSGLQTPPTREICGNRGYKPLPQERLVTIEWLWDDRHGYVLPSLNRAIAPRSANSALA